MGCKDFFISSFAYLFSFCRRKFLKDLFKFLSAFNYKYFLIWFKKNLYSLPVICNDTGCGTGCFKHPGCRRKAIFGHTIPAYIEYCHRGAVKGIMILCIDVPQVLH